MNQPPISLIVQSTGFEPLPIGSYLATFKGMETFTLPHPKPGENPHRLRFVFEVCKGQYAGKEPSCLCEAKLTAGNRTGRLIAGMAGRPVVTGEDATPLVESFVGQRFVVTVAMGPKGGKAQVQPVSLPPEM